MTIVEKKYDGMPNIIEEEKRALQEFRKEHPDCEVMLVKSEVGGDLGTTIIRFHLSYHNVDKSGQHDRGLRRRAVMV